MIRLIKVLLLLPLIFSYQTLTPQSTENDPKNLTFEEWQRQIKSCNDRRTSLRADLDVATNYITTLKRQIPEKDDLIARTERDLYTAVGTTVAGVSEFRIKFEDTERKLISKTETYNNLKPLINQIEASRIKCLPEFYDRFTEMKKNFAAMAPKTTPKTNTKKKTTTTPRKKERKRKMGQ